MASADQLKALLQSHLEGDETRFYSVAMQVAAHEAKRGHGKLAQLRIAHQALGSQSRREQHITAHQPEQKQRARLSALHIPASQQGKPEQHHASRRNQGKVQICRLAQFRFSAQETVNSTSSILRREVSPIFQYSARFHSGIST